MCFKKSNSSFGLQSFLALTLMFFVTANLNAQEINKTLCYQVKKIKSVKQGSTEMPIKLPWEKATEYTHFCYPWRNDVPPKTSFRALWDDENIYFCYEVEDFNVFDFQSSGTEADVEKSDRVEIFFLTNGSMEKYYCLEFSARGLLLDYEASYYRKFYSEWDWPANHLKYQASVLKNGYKVLGSFSLQSLKDLNILKQNELYIGLFRANVTTMVEEEPTFRWISWIDPKVPDPDFHVPSAFGKMTLIE